VSHYVSRPGEAMKEEEDVKAKDAGEWDDTAGL
jgi:hypothetical protein